jgi:Uma2 family endonuclease
MVETPERVESITGEPDGLVEERDERVVRHANGPITFEQFLTMSDPKKWVELVDGMLVEKPMVRYEHEKLEVWIVTVLNGYVKNLGLGVVLGSRSAVRINAFGARLPDVFFVPKEREGSIERLATTAAPDLIIEIVSPDDHRSHLIALEADYRSLGVCEILFTDPQNKNIRLLRKRGTDYDVTILNDGEWRSETVAGFGVDVAWLLDDPRPDEATTLFALLESARP